MDVAGQAVQFGNDDGAVYLGGGGQRRSQLRAGLQCIGTLAGLDLDVGLGDGEALGGGERQRAAVWASRPRPERPCFWVLTRM